MKLIRDSVHGNLYIDEFEVELVDTPELQRLRRIKQLGFTYLVYPGANHSRFEHSIGSLYLTSEIADNLKLDDHTKKLLRTCALLHDIGHGPFSHVSEGVSEVSHEQITSKLIMESPISDLVSEFFDPKEVIAIINGKGSLGQIMSGELDADRMDYLLRDSYYTGAAYGLIDAQRLIHATKLDNNLVFEKKGIQAAESALVARYLMYPSVYQHHTTRIINAMFRRCMRRLFDKVADSLWIYRYDDIDMIATARSFGSQDRFIGDIIGRLDNRNLFKRVFSLELGELENPEQVYKITDDKLKKMEDEISQDLDLDPSYVMMDIPEYPAFDEMRTLISVDGELVKLSEISNIVRALGEARFNHADLCIYMPEEYGEKVSSVSFDEYIEIPD